MKFAIDYIKMYHLSRFITSHRIRIYNPDISDVSDIPNVANVFDVSLDINDLFICDYGEDGLFTTYRFYISYLVDSIRLTRYPEKIQTSKIINIMGYTDFIKNPENAGIYWISVLHLPNCYYFNNQTDISNIRLSLGLF